ncbi:ATP-binding protein [Streptomyces sp. NPDC054784]
MFTQTFPATRQGARLARLRASGALAGWGLPPGSAPSDTVASVVAELANNAVLHGHVPGRDFALALTLTRRAPADGPHGEATPYSVLVEVADTRAEAVPPSAVPHAPGPDAESGRGLLLVAALAADWGVRGRDAAAPGKTVWARCDF